MPAIEAATTIMTVNVVPVALAEADCACAAGDSVASTDSVWVTVPFKPPPVGTLGD